MYKKQNISIVILLVTFVVFYSSIGFGQNYRFSVPELKMNVYIQDDASARVVYDITFQCADRAHVIDIVDIGMPHKKYSISTMSAAIDGVPLKDIRHSEYVKPGVEIHLAGNSIKPNRKGTFHFEFTMPRMVYQDTTRKDYASFRITPTWFGERFVIGVTEINIAIHMLPGIETQELLYQNREFTSKVIYEERAVAVWKTYQPLTGPFMVGISFPKRGMEYVIKQTAFDLLVKWFKENEEARWISGLIFIFGFIFVFFRFTGNTGFSLFVPLTVGLIYLFVISPEAHLVAMPSLVVLAILNEWILSKRKKTYLPPIAEIEAGRIKRGLTAPEAAILLELPINKVLTLIIFGMIKKSILNVVQPTPLTVDVDTKYRLCGEEDTGLKDRIKEIRQAAEQNSIAIHNYELDFLAKIQGKSGVPLHKMDFSYAMKILINRVVAKMKGFDPAVTREYYRSIISKAMQTASAIGEIPVREKYIDRRLDWILLDDDYPRVLSGRVYSYRPWWSRHTGSAGKPSAPSTTGSGKTTFGDVAASFSGWTQNTMNNLASAITPGTLGLQTVDKGVVNLSGVDKVTADVFEAIGESASKGGGGGGGCACACAGCACACACAGGGR